MFLLSFFFFKQKTAYGMRISDWSSDLCSSDLRDIGVIAVDDLVAFDRSVDAGHVTQRQRRRLHEKAHEAQADAMLLFEQILVAIAGIHDRRHVDVVERGQHRRGILGFLQPRGDGLADAGHPHPLLLAGNAVRSEEHTSELQSLMRISYAVFCLKKKTNVILKHADQLTFI